MLNPFPSRPPCWWRGASVIAVALAVLAVPLAQARVIYVSQSSTADPPDGQSWATAFPSVQQGIDAAVEGDEVWVAAATYVGLARVSTTECSWSQVWRRARSVDRGRLAESR